MCPCGHHEGYHNDGGACLMVAECGCAGLPAECRTPLVAEFHWRDGWMFAREDTYVHVWNVERGVDLRIPLREWASIVNAVE